MIIPKLIIGLGNPEPKYKDTRHNIGFTIIDRLEKNKALLLKPSIGMNNSGKVVKEIVNKCQIPIESILVIYDDMNLPLGKLRIRLTGSDGGHNGVKSIIAHLNSNKFPRLRIGIGKHKDEDILSFVLGRFTTEETESIEKGISLAIEAINYSLSQGIEKTMNLYN